MIQQAGAGLRTDSRLFCVMAYAFGDGFSTVSYVTNPVLPVNKKRPKTVIVFGRFLIL